jgi:hypothetical protein
MEGQFEQQEREVDRRIADLATLLDGPLPRPEHIAAVKNAVDREARRLRRRQRRLVGLRPWIGAAAAVALAVGLSLPFDSATRPALLAPYENPAVAFNDWVNALDESGRQFTSLLGDNWLLEASGSGGDENGDVGEPLDSLKESLESFEIIIGA